MTTADKELEIQLHGAYARGEFSRLARFIHWCASQVSTPSMAHALRQALQLTQDRAGLPPELFNYRAAYLRGDMPGAECLIGLRHGDPRASQALTLRAAIGEQLLDAALHTACNHRLHRRFVAERAAGPSDGNGELPPSTRPGAIGMAGGEVLRDRGEPPSRSEALCAQEQLAAWLRDDQLAEQAAAM